MPVVLALLVAWGCASAPPPPAAKTRARPAPRVEAAPQRVVDEAPLRPAPPSPNVLEARAKGWGWLVEKLAADGLPRERAARAFADPRVPPFDQLYFNPDPAEPRSMYRGFLRAESVARARRCAALHGPALEAAERLHGVDASVVAAILHVETGCGANTGRSLVLHRLARLAMANEPANVARNLSRWTGSDGVLDPRLAERIRARARYLEGVFYPQVLATFEVARIAGIDPLAIRGSSAGAFGMPQFLPMNYLAFATDANGDGRASLFDPEDAIASCARFLASHGWRRGLTPSQQHRVLRAYNPSDPYVDTVLTLAGRIAASRVIEIAAEEAAASGGGAPALTR